MVQAITGYPIMAGLWGDADFLHLWGNDRYFLNRLYRLRIIQIGNRLRRKKKLEQRKEFKEYLSIADKRVLDIKKSGIELIADDEVSWGNLLHTSVENSSL